MTRPVKDCFGTVISSQNKMKECVRCELLAECRAINWPDPDADELPAVTRRPLASTPDSTDPSGAGSLS